MQILLYLSDIIRIKGELCKADNAVHRRAHVVAHTREEIALCPLSAPRLVLKLDLRRDVAAYCADADHLSGGVPDRVF